jgi:hypothetical protein
VILYSTVYFASSFPASLTSGARRKFLSGVKFPFKSRYCVFAMSLVRFVRRTLCVVFLPVVLALQGCLAMTVVGAAVSVGSTVVGTAVDVGVGTAKLGAKAVGAVVSDSDDKK